MPWYDTFAAVYDAGLERHYAPQRRIAADALDLRRGDVVLDCPVGTGQSLPFLVDGVGPEGHVVGVDLSEGMVAKARARAAVWPNVTVAAGDAGAVGPELGGRVPTRLHIFLGLSVFPEPERRFRHLWDRLAPGGVCVICDVYADPLGLNGRMINWIAEADVRRASWAWLEAVGQGFERRTIADRWADGGEMWLARATKG